ncbi:MAG: hypothetical protein LH472_03255 [Pyrinomonadaceae bacterium]|nr:hypothetical protein [Pyrinomonadaceae bacterium]
MNKSSEQLFFERLDEKQKRLFAALKANQPGYFGVHQVSLELGIHPHTIRVGQKELVAHFQRGGNFQADLQNWWWTKKNIATEAELIILLDEIVESQTAGSPMNEKVRWTNLKTSDVVKLFGEKGVQTSRFIARTIDQNERLGEAKNE